MRVRRPERSESATWLEFFRVVVLGLRPDSIILF
jgi:hypothetical protein